MLESRGGEQRTGVLESRGGEQEQKRESKGDLCEAWPPTAVKVQLPLIYLGKSLCAVRLTLHRCVLP